MNLPDPTTPNAAVEQTAQDDQVFVWRYLRLLGASPDVADDLAQEVLVRFLQVEWDGAVGQRRAWVQRTARHLWLQRVRWLRRRRESAWVDAVDEVVARRWADGGDRFVAALGQCMDRLTDRARAAVTLRHSERHSRASIADRLGMKIGGVKILLERTRRVLRECIQQEIER